MEIIKSFLRTILAMIIVSLFIGFIVAVILIFGGVVFLGLILFVIIFSIFYSDYQITKF